MPVMPTPTLDAARSRTPTAIASATGSLTAPLALGAGDIGQLGRALYERLG